MMGVIEGRAFLVERALSLPAHSTFEVSASEIPHPLEMGFERSVGAPEGQIADFRLELSDGSGLHVRQYRGFFRVHWDRVHPTLARWWDHLKEDAPVIALFVLIGIALAVVLAIFLFARALSRSGGRSGASAAA